jgi:uncharacterized repeat protein (TIGR01451 family)
MNLGILALTLPLTAAAPPPTTMPMPTPMHAPMPMAMPAAAPFTFVKVIVPEGAKTTWYPGTAQASVTASGTTVGLRPGYSYRFEVGGVGENRNATIWPSIEVRGALIPHPGMNIVDHPVPIILSEEDITRILEGRYVSKVYFLEDPDKAINGPVPPGVPLELSAASEYEAMKEARERGRMMLVVRIGERLWTKEELASENTPGTILLPGMKSLPIPACPPRILYGGIPLYDPLLGPAIPCEECLHDGGDHMRPLGIGKGEKLYGLDPSDTAIEFNTPRGKKVATSNRVCICVPRYGAMRTELLPSGYLGLRGAQFIHHIDRQQGIAIRVPNGAVVRVEQPIGAVGQSRASATLGEKFPMTLQNLLSKPTAVSLIRGTYVAATVVHTVELTAYPCGLILLKRMEPPNPQRIGEEVNFYLHYRNPTNEPMTEVVVSDSLTARLEYLEGTAKSDRPATFTATPNEAGSVILRWAIDGKLLPGESGVLTFKARIR